MRLGLIWETFFGEMNIGHFFENMNIGIFFQVLLIDVRLQSKLFLKNDIINLKNAFFAISGQNGYIFSSCVD